MYNFHKIIFFLILIEFKIILSQIFDNYESNILEEGNYDILDVTDYHNISLIVSTSKNIYTGLPPEIKVTTNANLINATSLITINENYLLVACLQDSFLGKISLSDGNFISLLSYENISTYSSLEIPIKICSLSNIDNTIFIGYSKIEYFEETNEMNKTNIIFQIDITNKDSTTEGPLIDVSEKIKSFQFPKSTVITSSSRQISCEPLKIKDDIKNEYRLICLHEGIYEYSTEENTIWENKVYAVTINSNLSNFEVNMTENQIKYGDNDLGFRIYKENDTYARCITSKALVEIYLKKTDSITQIRKTSLPNILYNLNAKIDLFSYNNKFRFFANKAIFMGKENIYYFQINHNYDENYFKLYNYKEKNIKKIIGYYSQDTDKIICLFQTNQKIKYFIFDYKSNIFSFDSSSYYFFYYISSFEEIEHDLNYQITNPSLSDLGYLNVESIKYELLENIDNETLYYGIDFYETLITNNLLIPEPSLNDWKTYYLSFIDHIENEYTRIYHIYNLYVKIQTCDEECLTCWDNYLTCTNCTVKPEYAKLIDYEKMCYPPSYKIPYYIYDNETNEFLYCYESCLYCSKSENLSSENEHNCAKCIYGYLYSYEYPGNCYEYPNLSNTEEKRISDEIFISAVCSNFKIASTGECVEQCPLESPYYTYKYNTTSEIYEKILYNPPKYSFNKICYEECPTNTQPDINNNCLCKHSFYKDTESEKIICLYDDNCTSEYPYKNNGTKECFSSLDDCDFFFEDDCYSSCPDGKVDLFSQTEDVKNYIKTKLSLNDTLADKICICNISNGVWSNINAEKNYHQECLTSCPEGYIPESITNHCTLDKTSPTTNIIQTTEIIKSTLPIEDNKGITSYISSTIPNNVLLSSIILDSTIIINDIIPESIILPPINEQPNCPTTFENICYEDCPQGTCLTQEDPNLKTCIRMNPDTQVFNGICFENFESLTKNIKSMSENNEVLETSSGIIIRGYSSNSNSDKESIDKDAKYSLVYLGDCEEKLKSYYNLTNDTELFILGIDSPNKDISASINTYNYGVYLEDGTLLDHINVCKESKISISSPIINPELVKLEEASYFFDIGYDIFDENSNFYLDHCAPASINGNDVILSDRKKDFYPSNVSLCNDSCYYSQVDFNSKRFTCECDLVYNFSEKNIKTQEIVEEEDVGYIEYFLSLINYKIITCYELFYDYKSYYYNAGFYIAVSTLFFCLLQIIIFFKCGLRKMNKDIYENIPNKMKLKEIIKEQIKKRNEIKSKRKSKTEILNNNPPRKYSNDKFNLRDDNQKLKRKENNKPEKNKKSTRKTIQLNTEKMIIPKGKLNSKSKTTKLHKIQKIEESNILKPVKNEKKKDSNKKIYRAKIIDSSVNDKLNNSRKNEQFDENVEIKELNIIPYSQALRIDNRNYAQIFFSVIFSEIKIICLFYYKSPYEHLSILFSKYVFELCLDLTLNCILYTEDVISEKYNNNGSIKFFTTLSLSFMSNIISSIIAFVISKLADYIDLFEYVLKDFNNKSKYFLSIIKFKKILCIKLTSFFFIQAIFNLMMCYYLMIFCTVYHKTQGSIMINYITGIAESMAISLGLAIITSLMRYLSIKYRWKSIYYTSKYFFENF